MDEIQLKLECSDVKEELVDERCSTYDVDNAVKEEALFEEPVYSRKEERRTEDCESDGPNANQGSHTGCQVNVTKSIKLKTEVKTSNADCNDSGLCRPQSQGEHLVIPGTPEVRNWCTCIACYKFFDPKSNLKAHTVTHSNNRPIICTVCSESFSQSDELKTCMPIQTKEKPSIQTKEKPSICTVCSKSYSRRSSLKKHMMIHTNERPYVCTICCKSFRESGDLEKHTIIHTNVRPFVCIVCSRSFGRRGCLKRHMLVHTKEKPFICTVCRKSFGQRSSLKTHMMIHTIKNPYTCAVCSESFRKKSCLRAHMMIHSR